MRADRVRRVKGYREAWPEKEGGTGRKEGRKEELEQEEERSVACL